MHFFKENEFRKKNSNIATNYKVKNKKWGSGFTQLSKRENSREIHTHKYQKRSTHNQFEKKIKTKKKKEQSIGEENDSDMEEGPGVLIWFIKFIKYNL